MPFNSIEEVRSSSAPARCRRAWRAIGTAALAAVVSFMIAGCASSGPPPKKAAAAAPPTPEPVVTTNEMAPPPMVVLKEGDTIKIAFPSTESLNETVKIREDGMITLLGGKPDFHAAGLTTSELSSNLLKIYDQDIAVKEVTVTVISSAFPLYVQGAVKNPGKINPDHPLTVMDAILEAGGWDPVRANLKKVKIVRQKGTSSETFFINLQNVLDGKPVEQFKLQPGDIIIVPERFVWW